ncbi:helix-turn-helix domain-containing protein [Granulicella sibirica]|uniref:Transcriptional regulator, XRE family n=1 Tax=Granulicella sibirica TaxID=2479048 RepID=A0A4Q0T8W1_9BACT|nr:XRE family transcriptional regulator [Granulicella sibirica]RXH58608.1 transcriptional regulator, XRE family [Granulicella sibirica]
MATESTIPNPQDVASQGLPPVTASPETPSPAQQVDGEAAESFIAEKRIGERIKYLRLKKSMGLVELGRHTGLSASFLSQLETGRVVPTLRNLARIAMVFSKDLNYFFEPEPQTLFRVHRGKDRVRLPQTGVEDPAYFFESLGYMVPDRQLDPYFAEFLPPKAGREARAHQHVGCEFLYLLSGNLDLQHGETTYHIEVGDAVYFDATTIHSYRCSSQLPATALIVTLQQSGNHPNSARRTGLPPSPVTGRPRTGTPNPGAARLQRTATEGDKATAKPH